jgi:hypothetical protein
MPVQRSPPLNLRRCQRGVMREMADKESNLRRITRQALLGALAILAGVLLCAAFVLFALLTGLWHPYDR